MGQGPSSPKPTAGTNTGNGLTAHSFDVPGQLFANIPGPTQPQQVTQCLPDNPEYFAITVSNVFSPEECDELLRLSEAKGYEPALLNVGAGQQILATDIRNNDRCVIDSIDFAKIVYERIKAYVPQHRVEKDRMGVETDFEVIEVNERFRFLRYGVGMEFKPHFDGSFVRTQDKTSSNYGDLSLITLQIYLNDVEKGGETTFFMKPHDKSDPGIGVNPQKGMIILFQHRILHSGSPVLAGQKYCIRTDVMYRERPKIAATASSSSTTAATTDATSPTDATDTTSRTPQLTNILPDYPHTFAITIKDLFSKDECQKLIAKSEKKGYEPALVNVGYGRQELDTDFRNNDRCIIDDDEFADLIMGRLQPFLTDDALKSVKTTPISSLRPLDDGSKWNLIEVNERMRFLRYGPGMEFKPHYDGTFQRRGDDLPRGQDEDASFVTLQIYLNDVEEGGETTFFMHEDAGFDGDFEKRKAIHVNPSAGMAILFQHQVLHSGSPVVKGKKYCIRTDLMYREEDE